MKLLRALLLALLLAGTASATVTVNASFLNPDGTTNQYGFLKLDLYNCGFNVPSIPSSPGSMVPKSIILTPSQLPATVYANNEIACGNTYSSLWHVTAFADSNTPMGGDANYLLCSSLSNCPVGGTITASWNLATAMPFANIVPAPGFKSVFANPTQGQIISQPGNTSLQIIGNLDLGQAKVLNCAICGGLPGGTLVAQSLNQILWVDGITYTTIGQALALPPGGGKIMLPAHYRETITTPIELDVCIGKTTIHF